MKFLFYFLVLLIFSCGGGGKTINVTWSKVDNTCVNSSSGGYNLYYFTSDNFYTSDLDYYFINPDSVQVPYSSLSNPSLPSTTLKVSSGYTYIKATSYCNSNESSKSVYTYVYVE